MTVRYHANNIRTTLNGAITNSATSLIVTSATGFPSIGAGEAYRLTLSQGSKIEIVEVTDDASSPTLTVTRGMEGTTAQAFSNGATIEIRVTANSLDRKQDQTANSLDVIDFGNAASFEIPNSAAPTVNADGEIALDTTITDHKGLIKYYSGEEMVIPAFPIANLTANDGYSVMYDAATDSFKMAQAGVVATAFTTIAVSGQSDVVSDSATDTLTLAGGSNITITTNATTDTITFTADVRDANNNFSADNMITGYTTTATAAGTTTLTVDSTELQYFTGSTTQNCDLPVTSTLVLGQSFTIVNNSSGIVTIRSSGGNTVQAVSGGTSAKVVCILTSGTTAASWNVVPPNIAGVSTITGTSNQITASASTGAVTLSIPSNPVLPGTGGVTLPQGSTASRPGAGTLGKLRANTSTGFFEIDNGSAWKLIPGAPETVTANAIPVFNGTNDPTLKDSGVTISNSNLSSSNPISGYTTTATAAGTTTLTVSSTRQQFFTGTTTQTCKLPVTSTLVLGQQYEIVNNSTDVVTVQSSGSNTIVAMATLTKLIVTCISTSGTGTSSWDYVYQTNGSSITGSGSLVRATSPTLVTPTLGVASATSINFGGTALAYYAESTFTPTFTFATPGDLSVSYSVQTGTYTRIGRFVHINVTVNCTPTFTTGSGDIQITGLPFTPIESATGSIGTISAGYTWPASRTQVVCLASAANYVVIRANGSAVGTSNMGASNIVSAAAINLTFSVGYFI